MKHTKKQYKHLRIVETKQPIYPNAADQNYFAQKALDVMTGLVSCMGFVSAMLFLITLS
ncbi:MAG: hypothetical protein IJN67_08940 [Oscillospiraceae bacterium]|nr:hypothetical protein [Oscillospiraceae bacterium]